MPDPTSTNEPWDEHLIRYVRLYPCFLFYNPPVSKLYPHLG